MVWVDVHGHMVSQVQFLPSSGSRAGSFRLCPRSLEDLGSTSRQGPWKLPGRRRPGGSIVVSLWLCHVCACMEYVGVQFLPPLAYVEGQLPISLGVGKPWVSRACWSQGSCQVGGDSCSIQVGVSRTATWVDSLVVLWVRVCWESSSCQARRVSWQLLPKPQALEWPGMYKQAGAREATW